MVEDERRQENTRKKERREGGRGETEGAQNKRERIDCDIENGLDYAIS